MTRPRMKWLSALMPGIFLIGLIWLSSREKIMGEHRPRPVEWVLLAGITAFSLFVSYLATRGLVADIGKML